MAKSTDTCGSGTAESSGNATLLGASTDSNKDTGVAQSAAPPATQMDASNCRSQSPTDCEIGIPDAAPTFTIVVGTPAARGSSPASVNACTTPAMLAVSPIGNLLRSRAPEFASPSDTTESLDPGTDVAATAPACQAVTRSLPAAVGTTVLTACATQSAAI